MKSRLPVALTLLLLSRSIAAAADGAPPELFVNGITGNDTAAGDRNHALKSLSAAIARLPEPLTRSVRIEWISAGEETTGGHDMAANSLVLMRRMRPGVQVFIVGKANPAGELPKMSWQGGEAMVDARDGNWWLEKIQIGTGTQRQRRGIMVSAPACVTLKDVTFRTRSFSDAGIYSHRGGLVLLRGAIKLNEHLHEKAEAETFAGIIATDHGIVRFEETENASLDIGNGSLSAGYYGVIRLGCKTVRISNWTDQSNCLAVNNSGRIDLHNSVVRLSARQKRNTPVGLEHDGHILGEGATLIIESDNQDAIVLQKASTFTCNTIEVRGSCPNTLVAMSGSMFVGRFITAINGVHATTGASINIEAAKGKIAGPVSAERGGTISLPDGKVISTSASAE